ncbi:hypothetical protein CGRA01v4_12881 [Colletotrichum graminicola]|nr:hypothetical protein CGRA01v4_12881 [Colletotrichum graminicola]
MRAAGSLILGPLTLLLGRYLGVGTPGGTLSLTPTHSHSYSHSHSPRSPHLSLSLCVSLSSLCLSLSLNSLACTFSHPSRLSDRTPTTKVTLTGLTGNLDF